MDPRSIAWLLLCPLAMAGAQVPPNRAALIQYAPSVVKIEAVDLDGRFQLGSGVIVAPSKVVTNCHVTRKASLVVILKEGLRIKANAQIADTEHDLCLLRVPKLEGEPVPIAHASALKAGEPVTAVGYTGGIGLQLSDGVVVAKHRWSGSDIIQSTNWFSSGASGGALFNNAGSLVGILTFRLRGGAAHYYSAPADWLLERLHDERALIPVGPQTGLTFWEESAERQPYFLRAAALERNRQWQALAELAQRWGGEAQNDAAVFYAQGVALDGLGQPDDSIQALEHCTTLDPDNSRGWARLAQVYRKQGRLQEASAALRRLAGIDPQMADELSSPLEKP